MYNQIADYYDEIFKLDPDTIKFTTNFLPNGTESILEVGCGTGSLSAELAKKGYKIIATDIDPEMLKKVYKKTVGLDTIKIQKASMLKLEQQFKGQQFDAIICYGNTLPHLKNNKELLSFFKQSKSLLKPEGILMVQLLNYNYILEKNISTLPQIETNNLIFRRFYKKRLGHMIFKTELELKESDKTFIGSVKLTPFIQKVLKKQLYNASFTNVKFYGGFDGKQLEDLSLPLIFIAK